MDKAELARLLISNMTQAEIDEQMRFGIELLRRSGLISGPAQETAMLEQMRTMSLPNNTAPEIPMLTMLS